MIIILKQEAPEQKVRALIEEVQGLGMSVNYSAGAEATILGLIGDTSRVDEDKLRANEVVADVRRITEPYKKANRRFHPLDPYRQQHDPSQGPACPQNAQHIPHCRPRG